MTRLPKSYQALYRTYLDSTRVNSVDEATEALYVRLLSASDDYGRFYADPFIICGRVLTMRWRAGQVTPEEVARRLEAMVQVGLIFLYEANGESWLQITNYHDAIDEKRRIARYPEPKPGECQTVPTPGTTAERIQNDPVPPVSPQCPQTGDTLGTERPRDVPLTQTPTQTQTQTAAATRVRAREADPPASPTPEAQPPPRVDAAAAAAAAAGASHGGDPPGPDAGPEAQAAHVFWSELAGAHRAGLAFTAAPAVRDALAPRIAEHGLEAVTAWVRVKVRALGARGAQNPAGLLLTQLRDDPFDPVPIAAPVAAPALRSVRETLGPKPDGPPKAAPYPPSLGFEAARKDPAGFAAAKAAGLTDLVGYLREHYPDSMARWQSGEEVPA